MASEDDKKRAAELVEQAAELLTQKDWQGVLALMDEATRLDPNNDRAWSTRGYAKNGLGEYENDLGLYEEAITNCDKAIDLNPNNDAAWSTRGDAKNGLRKHEEAITNCDRAIELNPNNDGAWSNRGYAKSQLGQYEDAIKDFDKAIEINPNNDNAWSNRGAAKTNLSQHADAIKDYDEAIRLNPDNDTTWNNRSVSKSSLGQHEDAIKDCDKAIELNPNKDVAWTNRGLAKGHLGQHEDAIKDYDKALEINPNDDGALTNRGFARYNLGQHDDAIKDFNKALEINPNNDAARNNRAATKAELAARQAIEDRIGSLDNTGKDIKEEREDIKKDYKTLRKERDLILVIWIMVVCLTAIPVALFFFLFFFNFLFGKIIEIPLLGIVEESNILPFLSLWAALNFALSVPLLIFLRFKSRDAEELKILDHDYLRMNAIEARLDAYRITLPPEKNHELMEKQIDNWMNNSPAKTLIKFKGKGADKAAQHPAETLLSNCTELLQKSMELLRKVKKRPPDA